MGKMWFKGTFRALNWKQGVEELKRKTERTQNEFLDAINSCNFTSKGGCYSMKPDEIEEFIEERKDKYLNIGQAEVLKNKVVEYAILTTDYQEVFTAPFDTRPCLLNMVEGPAVLVNTKGYPIGEGTITQLKKRVHNIMINENYEFNYYIVSKKKTYFCTYKARYQKTTLKESNNKYLVLPVHEYIYYGWGWS